ncbi:hypothetical protein D9M68_717010 [compost metagenome]
MGARLQQGFDCFGHVGILRVSIGRKCSGRSKRLQQLVGKAGLYSLRAAEPGIGLEHRSDFLCRLTRLAAVGSHEVLFVAVEEIGVLAQIVRITDLPAPGFVDHQPSVFGHEYALAGHGHHRGHRAGNAVDVPVHLTRQAAQQVVDEEAIHHIAAV